MKTVSTPLRLEPSTVRGLLKILPQQPLQHQVRIMVMGAIYMLHFACMISGPGVSPGNIMLTSTSTVMWDRLSCVDRNGEITGYRIQYGITTLSTTVNIIGKSASDRTFTASGLVPLTTYMFRIAAVNSDGVGLYSNLERFNTTFPTGIVIGISYSPFIYYLQMLV